MKILRRVPALVAAGDPVGVQRSHQGGDLLLVQHGVLLSVVRSMALNFSLLTVVAFVPILLGF
jgi:broad specificity phosphatase PhoE